MIVKNNLSKILLVYICDLIFINDFNKLCVNMININYLCIRNIHCPR